MRVTTDDSWVRSVETDPRGPLAALMAGVEDHPDACLRIVASMEVGDPSLRGTIQAEFPRIRALTRIGLRDRKTDCLEGALRAHTRVEAQDPASVAGAGHLLDALIMEAACALDRAQPGRAHELLGWTKIQYLGADRVVHSSRLRSDSRFDPAPYVGVRIKSAQSLTFRAAQFVASGTHRGEDFVSVAVTQSTDPHVAAAEGKDSETLVLFSDGRCRSGMPTRRKWSWLSRVFSA